VLSNPDSEDTITSVRSKVNQMMKDFPIFAQ